MSQTHIIVVHRGIWNRVGDKYENGRQEYVRISGDGLTYNTLLGLIGKVVDAGNNSSDVYSIMEATNGSNLRMKITDDDDLRHVIEANDILKFYVTHSSDSMNPLSHYPSLTMPSSFVSLLNAQNSFSLPYSYTPPVGYLSKVRPPISPLIEQPESIVATFRTEVVNPNGHVEDVEKGSSDVNVNVERDENDIDWDYWSLVAQCHKEASTRNHELTAYAVNKVSNNIESGRTMSVESISVSNFEVISGMKHYIVDIVGKKCWCKEFDLDLIHCSHAAATLRRVDHLYLGFDLALGLHQDPIQQYALDVDPRPAPPTQVVPVIWRPPPCGWIKINTDGSTIGAPGSMAMGGIFCGSDGQVLCCFHSDEGVGFAFLAELLAVIFALEQAQVRSLNFI
ncbi:hypothetical protein C2S53_005089 [Perilla frutescens var. hirtella]|uniref:SWIM-type domain-containing protein n=1 Tax=Perilla frutescens var. hirtella TaxID=608512 RepID=A0AAD4P360_PERFH|nr:hypothetical protein C2S53_005089 [Perilla frutescens var. hirtella]